MTDFTIEIQNIKTGDYENLKDVVKQVGFTLTGVKESHQFNLPEVFLLQDPDPNTFVTLNNLTEQQVTDWLWSHPKMVAMKNHIEMVLDMKVEESKFKPTTLPWN